MPQIKLSEAHDALTLSDLVEQKYALAFHCRRCGTLNRLDLDHLVAVHGAMTRVGFIRRTTGCETCGAASD